jgi:hypothetical protein
LPHSEKIAGSSAFCPWRPGASSRSFMIARPNVITLDEVERIVV